MKTILDELDKLREEILELKKLSAVGNSIETACEQLPEDWNISINMERDSGYVNLYYQGSLVEFDDDNEGISSSLKGAIEFAKKNKC